MSAIFVLLELCKFECRSGPGNALSIQFIRREARKVTFGSPYQRPSPWYPYTLSRYLQTLSLPGDQYALWCVTIMSGTSWSPWHRIDWGHTMTLLSNERPGMTSKDQSQAAASHLPESPAVSELPWWMLAIVTNADIWCYVLCSSWSEMRNMYQ